MCAGVEIDKIPENAIWSGTNKFLVQFYCILSEFLTFGDKTDSSELLIQHHLTFNDVLSIDYRNENTWQNMMSLFIKSRHSRTAPID